MTKTKKIQILLMTIVTLGICTFIMWKTLDKEDFVVFSNDNNATNSSNDEYIVTKETALEYINQYNLNYVLRASNQEELTNQDKLIMAFEYLTNQETVNFKDGVNKANFETFIHYVFGVEEEIENTNIKYKNATISYNEGEEIYTYPKEINPIEYKAFLDIVTDFKTNSDTYEITIASIYVDEENNVYSNYNDYKKRTNAIIEVETTDNIENDYYDEIKEDLQKVKYTLKYEGKHLVLSEYEILTNEI